MEERRLGPVVGLGTWNTFDGDTGLAREVVGAALAAGVRSFDSSPMYGGAEASLAAALEGRREDGQVLTKIWSHDPGEARRQLDAQLRWFGRIEVEQIHNLVRWQAYLPWLEDERDAGRIGRIGVTHYSPLAFDELARALRTKRFDTVQLPPDSGVLITEATFTYLPILFGIAVLALAEVFRHGVALRDDVEGLV